MYNWVICDMCVVFWPAAACFIAGRTVGRVGFGGLVFGLGKEENRSWSERGWSTWSWFWFWFWWLLLGGDIWYWRVEMLIERKKKNKKRSRNGIGDWFVIGFNELHVWIGIKNRYGLKYPSGTERETLLNSEISSLSTLLSVGSIPDRSNLH